MIMSLVHFFSSAAQVCLLLSILLWCWHYRSLPLEFKRLGFFMVTTLIINVTAIVLGRNKIQNLFLLHIYTPLEWLLWAYFYQLLFKPIRKIQKGLPWLVGVVLIFLLLNSILLEPISGFNSNAKSLVQVILIAAAITYFFNAFGKIDLTMPIPRALSIVNFAVIFYYSGSLFIFMFSRFLNDNQVAEQQQFGIWAINGIIYFLFTLLIFSSLWTVAFQKTKSS